MTDVSGVYYTVINDESCTARIGRNINEETQNALVDASITNVELYSYVTLSGRRFRVTEIGVNAFYKTKIKRIVIPKTIEIIRAKAFIYCYNLTSVRFEEGSRL